MAEQLAETATISGKHIGGIDETEVSFSPGVTVLAGRNATNRTSFLQSIMAVCGSNDVSMKADADEASVELTLGDDVYTRHLRRQNGTVVSEGDPYLDDPTVADLFAFLLESNEARRAVARGDDLREIIMRPVDTDEIRAEIDRLLEERREVDDELEDLDQIKRRLPKLEEKRTRLRSDIEDKRDELAATEEQLESAEIDVEAKRSEKAELEETLEELRGMRGDLEDVRYELETERESLKELRRERNELDDEQEDLPETPVGDADEVEARMRDLRQRKQRLDEEVGDLHNLIQFNEEMLDGNNAELVETLDSDGGADAAALTEQLLEEESITCWTCGTQVEKDQIESTVDQLRELSRQKIETRNGLESDLGDLREKKRELDQQQRRRDQIDRRLRQIDGQIDDRESAIETLQDRREQLNDEIESLEADVEEFEDESYNELLDVHKQANQLEFELGKLEGELDDVEQEIASIEDRLAQRSDLEARRDEVAERLGELRTKVDQIESQAVEQFNEHMETVLDILGYANIDRIWLERLERNVRQGRKKITKSQFELHIVRSTESGTTYEDTVDNLSESEREVTGLVFALAGYLVHEVYETVPFMLLDSMEAIDSNRIARLVEYFEDYTDYLVIALLPEDAAALDDGYQRVTEI
ncbi:archaea-specific SMC-related protein [Haloarculaceae archaeon H-GB2-1]|nr:AAA family ATPase [Haloarculaceae archaeon H-GB1-1]MEA5406234.1 archaea-specific SMC-related protein [Haloarculaceae archaeon H-GB2-1]